MRYCKECDSPVNDFEQFCMNCGTKITETAISRTEPYQTGPYERQYPGYYPKVARPTGISILTILIGIGLFVNAIDGISNLSMSPLLGMYSLGIAMFQIIVIYGLWNMKTWGGVLQ